MIGYKAFNEDWTCKGFKYEIGKTYELGKDEQLKMCECGFHFCANPIDVFGYYPMVGKTKIAEVEALGNIEQEGTKFCTDKIRIIKEYTQDQLQELIRDGNNNSGNSNSGNCNSGDFNSGDFNSGDFNSGDFNSGDFNSGNSNSGYSNSGNSNSGNSNSGYSNSGCFNSGNYNSGDFNSGNSNSGCFNSGNYNSGDFNSGNSNSGIFNSDEPKMRSFNRLCSMTFNEFMRSLDYSFYDLCKRITQRTLDPDDKERILRLPNFDVDIFEEITGIRMKGEQDE